MDYMYATWKKTIGILRDPCNAKDSNSIINMCCTELLNKCMINISLCAIILCPV